MKHHPMGQKSTRPRSAGRKPGKADAAFDVWLQRSLHRMFDDVAQEPVPEDLLKLIEDDRAEKDGTGGEE
jgi:hypothetical protein